MWFLNFLPIWQLVEINQQKMFDKSVQQNFKNVAKHVYVKKTHVSLCVFKTITNFNI